MTIGAAQELAARKAWSLARLGEVLNEGRDVGWLDGPVVEDLRAASAIDIRCEAPTAMDLLRTRFALSSVELDILWLLACIELEPAIAATARLVCSPGMAQLDAQTLGKLCPGTDSGTLRRLASFALLDTVVERDLPLYRRAVRVTDRILDLARGRTQLDPAVGAFVSSAVPVHVPTTGSGNVDPLVGALADAGIVVVVGPSGSGRRDLIAEVAARAERSPLWIEAAQLPRGTELGSALRAIARECRLFDLAPVFLALDDHPTATDLLEQALAAWRGAVAITARAAPELGTGDRVSLVHEVRLPTTVERAALWRASLARASDATIAICSERYTLAAREIEKVSAIAARSAGAAAVEVMHVQEAIRTRREREIAKLARRVRTTQTWADLMLPHDQGLAVLELVARVRHRTQVYDEWGFAEKVGRGLGLTALLSGPPGTGKTMLAGLVAQELGLELYQVDLSKIVSKYIGETEKQLGALFDAAETGFAILLFDEADSIFGKRTTVASSNDRYANLEVNYLLQRIEQFTGIVLLTTNHENAIDPAFQRRLALHIRLPMPDEGERGRIWRAMLPRRAATAPDLDLDRLAADFVMSGGYIKNAVIRAAFVAADEATPISNGLLRYAARMEYEAMGKLSPR